MIRDTLSWQDHAACLTVDAEIFFPARGESGNAARMVCATCPVRLACLRYAVERREQFGVWGGASELERRRLRRNATLLEDLAVVRKVLRDAG